MPEYSILVVDDQPSVTKDIFEKLFSGDTRFQNVIQTQTLKEFKAANIASYDAILLDINLDHWHISISDALEIIGDKSPVVLVSRFWHQEQTHRQISDALTEAKEIKFIATLILNNLEEKHWEDHAANMRFQLSTAIDRNRRKARLKLTDDAPVRILHLSDPQYGDPNNDAWAEHVEDEIAQFIKTQIRKDIHFIAITGDISYSGEVDQYRKAEERLRPFIQSFLPANECEWRERIMLVPGNHDVNLRLAAADKIKINKDLSIAMDKTSLKNHPHRRFALAPFRDFASRLTGDPRWHDADELSWINDSFIHIGLRFFLFNSATTIDCDHPQKAGFWHDRIRTLENKEQIFAIAFSHHGPPEAGNTGSDSLSDWPQTVPFLKTRGIRLFIHGHGHERKVDRFNRSKQTTRPANGQLDKGEILRIMAPTTHLNGNLRPKGEVRGFNLITLQRKHGNVQGVKVESYDALNGELEQSEGSPWECRL